MGINFYNRIKINHYEASIQDIEAQIPKKECKKKRIMEFIKKEYKRRIEFFKQLDKIEKGESD